MSTFHFELVSPEKLLFSGEVDSVVVPASEGEMTVLAGHAATMTTLQSGIVTVRGSSGQGERLFVDGGFVDITGGSLTILAEVAVPVNEIDVSNISAQLKDLEDDLADARDEDEKALIVPKIERLRSMVRAAAH